MINFDKAQFVELIKIKPQWLIGKEIISQDKHGTILDVSIGGDLIFLETCSTSREWISTDTIGDKVIVNIADSPRDDRRFTVQSTLNSIETLEKLVGQPSSEHPKALFKIVEALNRDMLELKMKVKEQEEKNGAKS